MEPTRQVDLPQQQHADDAERDDPRRWRCRRAGSTRFPGRRERPGSALVKTHGRSATSPTATGIDAEVARAHPVDGRPRHRAPQPLRPACSARVGCGRAMRPAWPPPIGVPGSCPRFPSVATPACPRRGARRSSRLAPVMAAIRSCWVSTNADVNTPLLRPSRSTTMRSATARTSSMLCADDDHAEAACRAPARSGSAPPPSAPRPARRSARRA